MLRKFKINIDGKQYMVEMEEIGAVAQPVQAAPVEQVPVQAAPVQAAPQPAAAPVAEPAPAPQAAPAGAGTSVDSPMPGNIIDVKVQVGQQVQAGDVLVILEAMKMENEIVAPKDGTVVGISVSAGQTVNSGDPLVSIG